MRWIIQGSGIKPRAVERLTAACARLGLEHRLVRHVPFSDALPDVPVDEVPTVFYGAVSLVERVHRAGRWAPGVFFDDAAFAYGAWLPVYGEHALNHGAAFTTLAALADGEGEDGVHRFIRPVEDSKAFAGDVQTLGEIRAWVAQMRASGVDELLTLPVVAAEPVGLADEWRVFVVEGRAAAGSHYRSHHRLDVRPGLPAEVVAFAEARARDFAPAPVFVMDIARSGPGLYVIELNCFNSSGFYDADVEAVLAAVSEVRVWTSGR